MHPVNENSIKDILVSRLRFMGDVILTTPFLHVLRSKVPEAQITYLAEAPYAALLENHPAVDKILILDRKRFGKQAGLILNLIRHRFDVSIDLLGNPRSALLTFLAGAPLRIGGDFRGRRKLYTHPIHDDKLPKSPVDFHLQYLEPLGMIPEIIDQVEPCIVLTEVEKAWANRYLKGHGYNMEEKIIALHAGASWPAKRWFPGRFSALANRLVTELGVQIYFVVGPGNEEIIEEVRQGCTFETRHAEVLPLRKLGAVLSLCNILISNDSGPMHLAPAVGTKTVGVFGPGEPEIWFPYKPEQGHRLVYKEVECSRCRQDFCDSMECMRGITVDQVFNTASELLDAEL